MSTAGGKKPVLEAEHSKEETPCSSRPIRDHCQESAHWPNPFALPNAPLSFRLESREREGHLQPEEEDRPPSLRGPDASTKQAATRRRVHLQIQRLRCVMAAHLFVCVEAGLTFGHGPFWFQF